MFLGGEKISFLQPFFHICFFAKNGRSLNKGLVQDCLLPNMKPKSGLVFKDHAALEQMRKNDFFR